MQSYEECSDYLFGVDWLRNLDVLFHDWNLDCANHI